MPRTREEVDALFERAGAAITHAARLQSNVERWVMPVRATQPDPTGTLPSGSARVSAESTGAAAPVPAA
jgi:hypothetical protein